MEGKRTHEDFAHRTGQGPGDHGGEDISLFEPLALEYLAAGVARQQDVKILDLRLEKNLQAVFEAFRPDVVGITAYTVHFNTVKDLSRKVKGLNSEAQTVVGGHHATIRPDDFVSPSVDLIVRGEGVHSFNEIVERYEQGIGLEAIPGVALAEKRVLCRESNQGRRPIWTPSLFRYEI